MDWDIVETIDMGNGNTLNIEQITYETDDPREWDNMSTMYCFHNNYRLGDRPNNLKTDLYDSFDDMVENHFDTSEGADIIVNLYAYTKRGITIATTPFSCRWDSGQLGFAVVTKETIIKEFGDNSMESRAKARHNLQCEVNTYDQYLRGEVYCYTITDKDGEEIDSCGGFYGSDHDESGLFENAGYKVKKAV